jgi:hypothetical protein
VLGALALFVIGALVAAGGSSVFPRAMLLVAVMAVAWLV